MQLENTFRQPPGMEDRITLKRLAQEAEPKKSVQAWRRILTRAGIPVRYIGRTPTASISAIRHLMQFGMAPPPPQPVPPLPRLRKPREERRA